MTTTPQTTTVSDEAVQAPHTPIELTYTNYRGETSQRRITLKSVYFGSTEWHPEPQWLLTAYDHDKQADRAFALNDFGKPVGVAAAREAGKYDAIIERLNGDIAQLSRMVEQTQMAGAETGVRVKSPDFLLKDLCDAVSAIRALSPAEQVDPWQDIATAPKDGSAFLAVNTGEIERWHTFQEGVVINVKSTDRPITCAFYNCDNDILSFFDEFGEVYRADGIVSDADDLTAADNVLRLTHWMPLPAAPTSKGGK